MTTRLIAALPAAAVCLAEGAWIAVIGALAVVVAPGAGSLGNVWLLATLVALGLVTARWLRRRDVRREEPIAGAIALLAGLMVGAVGMTISLEAAVCTGSIATLAVWRGSRHRDPSVDDVVTSDLLRIALPGLAVPWLLGAAGVTSRDAFVAMALPATLLFVAAALMAVGLTRLDALSAESGVDWASNRAWLVLLGGIVAGLAVISVPATLLLGAPLGGVVRGLLAPMAAATDVVGAALTAGLSAAGTASAPQPTAVAEAGAAEAMAVSLPSWVAVAVSAVLLALLIGAAAYVAWRVPGTPRDAPSAAPPKAEHHYEPQLLRLSLPTVPRAWRGLTRRRLGSVTDAYLAVLAHLATRDLGRATDESPRAHARRVREVVGWRLGVLAADFELERYGRRPVTAKERQRALMRARWLRRR